jgi:cytochrome c553
MNMEEKQSLNESRENYQTINIQNIDITTLSYQEMDNYFYHYSWEKFLPFYDINGIKSAIGENSQGIDPEASIFFSKGIEGVLELWDVWLKWRLNRQNNPKYKGNTPEEIQNSIKRFQNGNISASEKKQWDDWVEKFKNNKCLEDNYIMEQLYNYEFNEMQNSCYFTMDLKENDEFTYDQVDIKKQWAIETAKRWQRDINPSVLKQYGEYSDFSTSKVDKWNMQTIPGKNILIEPHRITRLNVDGKTDVYSIVKFMYDKYKKEVPEDKQVKFDILDKYINYVEKNKVNKDVQDKEQEMIPQNVQTKQQLMVGNSSAEIDGDLDDFEKQERQILTSAQFTEKQKRQIIQELYENFDSYVEENPEHNKTR